MSDTYTKLFSSITESTVWGEAYSTRVVWVTMLAMADARGEVYGAVPGLARRANVTLEEAETALAAFLGPDPYSRTKEQDGRRIECIDGGWLLINHAKYGAVRNAEERKQYQRQWDRENRPSGHARQSDSPTAVRQQSDRPQQNTTTPTTPAPAPTPTLVEQEQKKRHVQRTAARFSEFWDAYPEKKGRAAAEKSWRAKGLDAHADAIIAHVQRMRREDDSWRSGYAPHGSTYVNGERWTDEPRSAKPAPQLTPSKTLTAVQKLQGMKHGHLDSQRDFGRADETHVFKLGSDSGS